MLIIQCTIIWLIILFTVCVLHIISFIVLLIQLTISENSNVCAFVCFDLIQFTYDLNHSIVFMNSPSYFITLIHCFVNERIHLREQRGKWIFCFDLIKYTYDSTHSIVLMHSYSYFITIIHCFSIQFNITRNSEASTLFCFDLIKLSYDLTHYIDLMH